MSDDNKPATLAEFIEEISDPMTQEAVAFGSLGCLLVVGFFVGVAWAVLRVVP